MKINLKPEEFKQLMQYDITEEIQEMFINEQRIIKTLHNEVQEINKRLLSIDQKLMDIAFNQPPITDDESVQ